jgi:KRAB domain-containing zinc finger protein
MDISRLLRHPWKKERGAIPLFCTGHRTTLINILIKFRLFFLESALEEYATSLIQVKTESDTVHSCNKCGGNYTTSQLLKEHIQTNHLASKGFSCSQCGKTFKHVGSWKNHQKTHRVNQCSYCPRQFKTLYTLKDHINSHTRAVVFKCDYCSKELLHKSSLIIHIRGHLGTKKKCMCELCGLSFNDATNMAIHIRTVHEKLRPFACHLCSKTFAAKKHLVVHIRKHTGDKPFQCEKCSKCFYTKSDSKNHSCGLEMGTYKCKVCYKVFSGRGNFTKHVRRSHSGYKPFKCSVCDKDFTCKYSMKRHEMSHLGVKPYSCGYCSYNFSQKSMLKRHISRIHDALLNPDRTPKIPKQCNICKRPVFDMEKHNTKCHGDTRYVCEICNKSYAQNTALNRHRRVVHLGMHSKCEFCGKTYQQRSKMVKHQMKVHNVVKTEVDFEESVASSKIGRDTVKIDIELQPTIQQIG